MLMSQYKSLDFGQTAVKGIASGNFSSVATAVNSCCFSCLCSEQEKRMRETTDAALGLIFELQINIEIVLSAL